MARYPESIDDLSPPPRKRGRLRYFLRHLPGLSATLLLALLVVIVLLALHGDQRSERSGRRPLEAVQRF